jgi:hypothetical protein
LFQTVDETDNEYQVPSELASKWNILKDFQVGKYNRVVATASCCRSAAVLFEELKIQLVITLLNPNSDGWWADPEFLKIYKFKWPELKKIYKIHLSLKNI